PRITWFETSNPFGYSADLIAWSRSLTPGHKLASNPAHLGLLSVYTPQYLAVNPVASIIKDRSERACVQAGRHPVFRVTVSADHATPRGATDEALAWLQSRRIDYVFFDKHDYGT